MSPRTVAVLGIDGSGKSTLIRRLLATAPEGVAVVHCPQYHSHPDAALGGLSRALDAYSLSADALGSFELKAAALYLQMTLFGPVERAMVDAFAPRVLVCERHPIVDTLAYGPFYQRMVTKVADGAELGPRLEAELERREPGAFKAILGWAKRENRRLGKSTPFWEIGNEVAAALAGPPTEVVAEFSRRYRTGLPDLTIFLDLSPAEALTRIQLRGGGGELHETAQYLGALRQSYQGTLAAMAKLGKQTVTIPTGGRSEEASLADLVRAADLGEGR
jgi:hypothetical protein